MQIDIRYKENSYWDEINDMKEYKDKKRQKKLRKKVQKIIGLSKVELNNMLRIGKISLQLQKPDPNIHNQTHLAFIEDGFVRYVNTDSVKTVITKKEYAIIKEWVLARINKNNDAWTKNIEDHDHEFTKAQLISFGKFVEKNVYIHFNWNDLLDKWIEEPFELDTEKEVKPSGINWPHGGYIDTDMLIAFEAGIDSVKSGMEFYGWMKNYTKNKGHEKL